MATSITVGLTTNQGVKKQKAISYINPNATNQELVAFGEQYVELTKSTYEKTTRIDRTECDTQQVKSFLRMIGVKASDTSGGGWASVQIVDNTITIPCNYLLNLNRIGIEMNPSYEWDNIAGYFTNIVCSGAITDCKMWSVERRGEGQNANQGLMGVYYRVFFADDTPAPGTVTCKLVVPANKTLDAYTRELTFNITAAEE